MSAISAQLPRQLTPWFATAAVVSWTVAFWQAAPRLMAGPLCASPQDAFAFAGHCPACFVAAGFTLATLASLAAEFRIGRTHSRAQA